MPIRFNPCLPCCGSPPGPGCPCIFTKYVCVIENIEVAPENNGKVPTECDCQPASASFCLLPPAFLYNDAFGPGCTRYGLPGTPNGWKAILVIDYFPFFEGEPTVYLQITRNDPSNTGLVSSLNRFNCGNIPGGAIYTMPYSEFKCRGDNTLTLWKSCPGTKLPYEPGDLPVTFCEWPESATVNYLKDDEEYEAACPSCECPNHDWILPLLGGVPGVGIPATLCLQRDAQYPCTWKGGATVIEMLADSYVCNATMTISSGVATVTITAGFSAAGNQQYQATYQTLTADCNSMTLPKLCGHIFLPSGPPLNAPAGTQFPDSVTLTAGACTPCSNTSCVWEWSNQQWTIVTNNCAAGCLPTPPSFQGLFDGLTALPCH